ncbi:hypothetical protein FGADI_3397 [Fusarium gaditjirri]|uniref:Uncharacterized protein n=1 Tax=Fusarium gaditjirri TaxID=282569 RepID=A0A8H4TFG9_9HYPO|nr:hypothetical protein FGADI_3397 [Fusarium gaditjirri]
MSSRLVRSGPFQRAHAPAFGKSRPILSAWFLRRGLDIRLPRGRVKRRRRRFVRRGSWSGVSVSGEISILTPPEEDIRFIDKKVCIPGFRKVKSLHKLAFNECLDRVDISHGESKKRPM